MITSVDIERIDPGRLRVGWTVAPSVDAAATVTICAGSSPATIDHDLVVATTPAAAGEVTIDLAQRRPYVSVAVANTGGGVIAAERLVAVEGTMNFRDLGGYSSADGRRVRWGLVFRSDALSALTDDGHELLDQLGIRVIHDLRYEAEQTDAPTQLREGSGIRLRSLPIGGGAAESVAMMAQVMAGAVKEITVGYMADLYRQLIGAEATTFAALLHSLAQPDSLPALFHCTAGKDRTGMGAALLLRLLGVADEVILDDYELTTRYRSQRRLEELAPRFAEAGVDVERVTPFFIAPRPALEAALSEVRRRGGVEQYLTKDGGLDPLVLERLRSELLEP